MGSNDDACAGGLLVGDAVGYGPGTTAVGLGVTLLTVSPALDGAAVGADENAPPRDPSTGLRVGGTTAPGEVGETVRLGASSSPLVFRREGVGVGPGENPISDVSRVGVLVGDAMESRPGVTVGAGMPLSSDSSFASGANIGAGEVLSGTKCPVGLSFGVTVALGEPGTKVGLGVCNSLAVSPVDEGGAGPANLASF